MRKIINAKSESSVRFNNPSIIKEIKSTIKHEIVTYKIGCKDQSSEDKSILHFLGKDIERKLFISMININRIFGNSWISFVIN